MDSDMQSYKLSGQITISGILSGLTFGILSAFALAIPYAYITIYMPFIYINLLSTIFLGLAVGRCVGKGARLGGLQSPIMYVLIGLGAGISAEYFNWVFWTFAISSHQLLSFRPDTLFLVAKEISVEGTWGMTSGSNVSGPLLSCIWAVEGGLIMFCASISAFGSSKDFLCCSQCKTWFKSPTKELVLERPENVEAVAKDLSSLRFKCLKDLKEIDIDSTDKFLRLDFYFCPRCSEFGCFSLTSTEMIRTDDDVDSKHDLLIDRLIIPTDHLKELL